MVNLASPCA